MAGTAQITRAMSLVAAVRLRKAQNAAAALEDYSRRLDSLLQMATLGDGPAHPLLALRPPLRSICLVIGPDRGLCGNFARETASFASERLEALGERSGLRVLTIGSRMARLVEGGGDGQELSSGGLRTRMDDAWRFLSSEFTGGRVDRVYLIYNRTGPGNSWKPVMESLLPLQSGADVVMGDVILEPSRGVLVEELAPECGRARLALAASSSESSEQMARLRAMTAATHNSQEMLEDLRLASNKLRQAAVTRELSEILAGSGL